MPKSSRIQIDSDEKKVMTELRKNANESIERIAKRCGFSRQKVWRIIKRLEKNKTIWGYTAITDDEKLNVTSFLVLIKRTNLPIGEKLAETIVSRKLESLADKAGVKVETSLYVHGVYDWVMFIAAEDIRKAKIFSELLNTTYQGYIADIHLLETMFPIRKHGILNPELHKLKEFL